MSTIDLTLGDSLGQLNMQLADRRSAHDLGQIASEQDTQKHKSLICIEARTAYTTLIDFLRWNAEDPSESQDVLIRQKHDSNEVTLLASELDEAIALLKVLGADAEDKYLESVASKRAMLRS